MGWVSFWLPLHLLHKTEVEESRTVSGPLQIHQVPLRPPNERLEAAGRLRHRHLTRSAFLGRRRTAASDRQRRWRTHRPLLMRNICRKLPEITSMVFKNNLTKVTFPTCRYQTEIPVGKRTYKLQQFAGSLLGL